MTGAEALSRLEEIGARIVLLPDGALDVTAPPRPETETLIDELAAHKPEAVAVLRARPAVTALRLPGREPALPCLACGRQCPEGVLFDTGACFETWKAARHGRRERRYCEAEKRAERRATMPQNGRTATPPAPSIPSPTSPEGGAS